MKSEAAAAAAARTAAEAEAAAAVTATAELEHENRKLQETSAGATEEREVAVRSNFLIRNFHTRASQPLFHLTHYSTIARAPTRLVQRGGSSH